MTIERHESSLLGEDVAIIDLLDRLLAGGVVVAGDITIGLVDIDLIRLSLRVLVSSVDALESS
jgi:hypothetical protein